MTPFEWFVVGSIILGIGAQATSMTMNYQAQKDAAKQARRMAEYQRTIAQNEANQELANRRQEEANERDMKRRRLATMESGYATSGVLLEGTPETFILEQAATEEYNIAQATQDSEQRAREIVQRGDVSYWEGMQEADARDHSARMGLLGGGLSIAGSLVGGYADLNYKGTVINELGGNAFFGRKKGG